MSDLAAALAALQADLPPIKRTVSGQHGKYAAYDKIMAVVRPLLEKHGFTWHTEPGLVELGGELRFVLEYVLEHQHGTIEGYYPLAEGPPQQQGAVITYARRYCLTSVLDLAIEGEDNMDAPTRRPVRSRTTGAEHERLRQGTHEPAPGQRPAERGPLPPGEDVWRDQPAGVMPSNDPEDKPGSITREQQRAMHAQFNAMGITDRDERLEWTKARLELAALASSSDLSYRQAGELLQALHEAGQVREHR